MSLSPEHELRPETEHFTPSIRLEFLRHDEKENEATSGNREGDEQIRLTPRGREHSTEIGKTKAPHPEVGLVYGSPRERSTEAALRQLLANEDEIMSEDSLEGIQGKIRQYVPVGKKTIETDMLDFRSGSGEFHNALYEHYLGSSKDALVFLREKSDEVVKKAGDLESTSYSRAAGNIAELLKKYIGVFPRWEKLSKEKPEEYEQYKNELQRFFGSHQTVLEPFLMKVIEKTEGAEAVQKFLEVLPSKNGFGYGEGFSVKISRNNNDESLVVVTYNGMNWELKPELVDELVDERDALNREILKEKHQKDQ